MVLAVEFYGRSNLVDRVPFVLTLLGAVLGALLGYWVATAVFNERPPKRSYRHILGILAIPVFCLFAGTYSTRSLFLEAAFIGAETAPTEAGLSVVSRQTTRRTWLGRHRVNVVLEPGTREFRVLVSKRLYSTIGPNPQAGEHCLKSSVETGRWGYRRVLAPNYFDEPLGLSKYKEC